MNEESILDNPVWHSLVSTHQDLSVGHQLAKRYDPTVSNFMAVKEPSEAAEEEMTQIIKPMEAVFLFGVAPLFHSKGWLVHQVAQESQMVHTAESKSPETRFRIEILNKENIFEMLELATTSVPSAFNKAAQKAGSFYGIRENDKLVSMGGFRSSPYSFVELSAICTHPQFRGKGYSTAIVNHLIDIARTQSRVPFLHVRPQSPAQSIYRKLGFVERKKNFAMENRISRVRG